MGVTLKRTHVVVPAEQTWQGLFPLSELDQIGMVSHTSVLYFYDRPIHEDWLYPFNNKVVNTLKESLSQALVWFYPLAGRLSRIEGGRFQLNCNALGSELIEADSTDKMSDFGDFSDCSRTMFRHLLPDIDISKSPIEELPLLSVQLTGFSCGGLCVAINFSHVLMDGRSVFHFIKEWARLARGEPLEVEPFLDRLALRQRPTGVDPPILNAASHVDQQIPFVELGESSLSDGAGDETSELRHQTLIVITADQIERLKKMGNQDHSVEMLGHPYSRVEVITAHAWRCKTMAREQDADQITSVYVIVDARSRLNPPLPKSYFGNAIIPVKSSSRVGDLISRPLSYACSKVREAVEQLTNEYIKACIEFFQKEPSLSHHQFMEERGGDTIGIPMSSPDIWVTSSLNLLAQNVDFGWGKEIYAGPPTGLSDDKTFSIYPHYRPDGSVKVGIGSHDETRFVKFFNLIVDSDDAE